jgi:DNA-binding response OmpR family regulator
MSEICTVLVIEPSDLFRQFLDVIVDHAGYDVIAVDMSELAQRRLEQQHFDVVILASSGVGQPIDPVDLAKRAAADGAAVIIVLDDSSHRRAFLAGGYAMLHKPFMPRTLIAELERMRGHGALACEPRPSDV